MLKDEVAVRVPKFKRKLSRPGLLEVREVATREAMPQRIIRPRLNTGIFARFV
jgi:hypothetical protein